MASKNWSIYKKPIKLFLILIYAFWQLRIWCIKFETSIAHVQVVILNITYHNRVITCKSLYATSSNKIVYIIHTSFVPRMMTFWMKIEWQSRCLLTGVKLSFCTFLHSFLCIVDCLLVFINYRKVYILHLYPVATLHFKSLTISYKKIICLKNRNAL